MRCGQISHSFYSPHHHLPVQAFHELFFALKCYHYLDYMLCCIIFAGDACMRNGHGTGTCVHGACILITVKAEGIVTCEPCIIFMKTK